MGPEAAPSSPLRSRGASPSRATRTATPTVEKITVYVATCQQHAPVETSANQSTIISGSVFKPDKFQTLVLPTATLADLRYFLMSQWAITKSSYAKLPPQEQFYTFKGRILRLDGTLDAYYIANNDTIYLRFASLGKIVDPWAMSTSELRTELKTRNAYVPKLQPDQLMLRLQELVMKESRMERLQRATKREQELQVQGITQELAQFRTKSTSSSSSSSSSSTTTRQRLVSQTTATLFPRPTSLQWPHAPSLHRTVFLSITQLERTYQVIPRDVLDPAVLVFDTERKWVFDPHNVLQKASFDYRYMDLDPDFLEFLTLKEEMGLVFWFRPAKSYDKLSSFFQSIDDPVTHKKYEPLMLKPTKWLTLCGVNGWEGTVRNDGRKRDTTKVPQFTTSIARVTTNLASQSFEYVAVQELLVQSNPTLLFAPM